MRIEDIATLIRGVSYKPEDLHSELDDGSVALLKNNNVNDDGSLSFDKVIYVDRAKVSSNQLLRPGDIIVCASGSDSLVGKAAQFNVDGEYTFGAFCKVVRPNSVNKRYLGLFFISPQYRSAILAAAQGAIMKNLRNEHLLDLVIDCPEPRQQEEIESKLDKVIGIIQRRKAQLRILDELVKARFVEMFGTLERPARDFTRDTLKNLCNKITDGKHGGCTQEDGTGRYFVGAREIYDDTVHYETAPQINVGEFEKDYRRCNVEKGDFLIVNTGATIGKTAIAVDERTEHTLLQKSVALLKTKQSVLHPVFLKYCYIVNDKMYKVESASAQPNLLLSKINATEIYVPPITLQEEFVTFVAQVDKSKVAVKKALDEAQVLFDSLMQQYFG